MYKYITLKYPEYQVYSIIEVEDNNTLDFIELPDNVSIFLPANKFDILPEIGQLYNVEENKFE